MRSASDITAGSHRSAALLRKVASRLIFLLTALSILVPVEKARSQITGDSPVPNCRIAVWRGFRKAAMTFTFDDNYRMHSTLAAPALEAHGFRGTFYIVTNRVGAGWAPGWDTVRLMALHGHEIGSHSKNHPLFTELYQHPEWADSIVHEFRDSRDTIDARLPFRRCTSFAWPGGANNDPLIGMSANWYPACRGSSNAYNGIRPESMHNICSVHIYVSDSLPLVNNYVTDILRAGGWLVERWHGFRDGADTNGYEPVPIQRFRDHLDFTSLHGNDLWVSTLDSVSRYIRERDSTTFVQTDSTALRITFLLTHSMQDSAGIYQLPLTLKIRVPADTGRIGGIFHGGVRLPYRLSIDPGEIPVATFEAVPNAGAIQLAMNPYGTAEGRGMPRPLQCAPNPFRDEAALTFGMAQAGGAVIRIADLAGRILHTETIQLGSGPARVHIGRNGLLPGVYPCTVTTASGTASVRLVLLP